MTTTEKPKRSLLSRIISLEGAMAAFGLYSLFTGFRDGQELQIFWGVMILGGLCVLVAVRRRDWKKHWEEIEAATGGRAQGTPPEHTDTTQKES
ncbi:MAG: hypothetical protein FIB02_11290 [Desulfuromonas sp.]|nr:hypothetical protein [Desulfuromonas sp.]